MVVHLEHTAPACRAVVGAIGFLGLALIAEPHSSVRRLDCERCILHLTSFLRRQVTVSMVEIQRRARIGEYSGCVAPIEHKIEEEAERG